MPTVIMGDLNFDPTQLNKESPGVIALHAFLRETLGLSNAVTFPTRAPRGEQHGEERVLDHVWARDDDGARSSIAPQLEAGSVAGSDHAAIIATLKAARKGASRSHAARCVRNR